jgi:hypothetical protein
MEVKSSTAILIVNWETYDFTKSCLISLSHCPKGNFQIIVVDNGSADGSGQRLFEEFQSSCTFLFSDSNLGFAGGNNLGLNWAMSRDFDSVLLLNSDTEVNPDFLVVMLDELALNPKLGMIQPMIVFMDNPSKIWSAGGKWIPTLGRAKTLGDRALLKDYVVQNKRLDWATGCCILITRQALEYTGLLNEDYFAYFEDVEWSLRCRDAGFEIGFADKAIIYHAAGGSSKKKHSEGTLSHRVFYFHVRNQLWLVRQRVKGLWIILAIGYHLVRFSAWTIYFSARLRFKKLKAVLKGVYEGLSHPIQSHRQ